VPVNKPDALIKPLSKGRKILKNSIMHRSISFAKKLGPKLLCQKLARAKDQLIITRLKYASISKEEFINDIQTAIATHAGYATAKIGRSQKHWMYYEILLSREENPEQIIQFERELYLHFLNQEGLFPAEADFYLSFNRFYMEHVRNLDCLGLFYDPAIIELRIIKYYDLKNKFIYYPFQEPDRSSPSNDHLCYLPHFKDRRLLLVCPFAGLLKERATQETFEGVWSKTGKKWFYPQGIDAVEFPYGFTKETHQKYPTVIDLYHSIMETIQQKDFDVALIAAGGLSIPIASTIKNMGKVAIDLGGHLQVLFGVIGQRWQDWDDWKRDYFNEYWINMPSKYRPKEIDCGMQLPDAAYW